MTGTQGVRDCSRELLALQLAAATRGTATCRELGSLCRWAASANGQPKAACHAQKLLVTRSEALAARSCHLDFGTRSRAELGPLTALRGLTSLVIIGQTWRRPDELRCLTQLKVRAGDGSCHASTPAVCAVCWPTKGSHLGRLPAAW